jgi:hypothetical protein
MFTQFIQWIVSVIKQNTCWHKYHFGNGHDIVPDYYECKKCGYIKK